MLSVLVWELKLLNLAWILRDGVVTSVLIGASKPKQILDNIDALKMIKFSSEELEAIEKICQK